MELWIVIVCIIASMYVATFIHEAGHMIFLKNVTKLKIRPGLFGSYIKAEERIAPKNIVSYAGGAFTMLVSYLIALIPLNIEQSVVDLFAYCVGLSCLITTLMVLFNSIIHYNDKAYIKTTDQGKIFKNLMPYASGLLILIILFTVGGFYFSHIYDYLSTL